MPGEIDRGSNKKAAGHGLRELRRSPEGGACELFVLLRKTAGRGWIDGATVSSRGHACQLKAEFSLITLGLDIGSNSVGSAWIDTGSRLVRLGVGIFPAGVDETDTKRGTPVNQQRREKRSQRRNLARRSARKRALRKLLTTAGLLPADLPEARSLFNLDPWKLRRDGLIRELSPFEFGRALVHLCQRRGVVGIETDPEDPEEGKVKEGIDRLRARMAESNAKTFGQFIADLTERRVTPLVNHDGQTCAEPVRNRQYRLKPDEHLYADRDLIREEFRQLWEAQAARSSPLSTLLTDDLRRRLDEPAQDDIWRHKGVLFGQRRTYWDTGTLGRCDLEPTDHRCPMADMYAQQFRVIETVNNIRVEERGREPRPLTADERDKVIAALREQKSGTVATVRKALGINKKAVKEFIRLNIERDEDREINTDWFYRNVIHGVFTEPTWARLTDRQRDAINAAILRFDADTDSHAGRLGEGCMKWWGLDAAGAERLVAAWRSRPKIEKRVNLSRKAIRNLLPYMNRFDARNNRWPTQIEARQHFAEDAQNGASPAQRARYALGGPRLTKADRHYLKKHPNLLPPAPMLANPVVRKAIHEVRRHVIAHIRKANGKRPDRIVIELARQAKTTERRRNEQLAHNRKREAERRQIVEDFDLTRETLNQQARAIERVLLCREQKRHSAYSNRSITDPMAAKGHDLEVDHIVPLSRSQDNGFSNKLLCFREENRGKGNQTVKEYLAPAAFAELEQRLGHLEKTNPRKWENLHRDPQPLEAFINSQLTDTAYAAAQVGQYLRDTLFDGERDGKRKVFFTRGSYTAILRRDLQLIDDDGPKDRGDHRHHAVDAVAIALTGPETIADLAHHAAEQERVKAESGRWPARTPLRAPEEWASPQEFREQVMDAVQNLVVSHRPVKRRLTGAFHEETAYGPVLGRETQFTNRISVDRLTPNHLRVPDGWDQLSGQFNAPDSTGGAHRALRKELAAMADPPPGKSGIVRDRALRDQIRRCFSAHGIDPDAFTKEQIKQFAAAGKLKMASGVPIKSVVLLRTNTDPVIIPKRTWDPATGRMAPDPDPRTRRVYIGGNNHHVELRQDAKGRWSGEVVTALEAARRVRVEKRPAVDRRDRDQLKFVMSLAEGETVRMRHPDTKEPGYFVVFKLDKPHTIHFVHHWDARASKEKDNQSAREGIALVPESFKALGLEPGNPPVKVRISPLGEVAELPGD